MLVLTWGLLRLQPGRNRFKKHLNCVLSDLSMRGAHKCKTCKVTVSYAERGTQPSQTRHYACKWAVSDGSTCVCMHVYTCEHMCKCKHVSGYRYANMNMCLDMCVHVCKCEHVSEYIYAHLCVSECAQIYLCV